MHTILRVLLSPINFLRWYRFIRLVLKYRRDSSHYPHERRGQILYKRARAYLRRQGYQYSHVNNVAYTTYARRPVLYVIRYRSRLDYLVAITLSEAMRIDEELPHRLPTFIISPLLRPYSLIFRAILQLSDSTMPNKISRGRYLLEHDASKRFIEQLKDKKRFGVALIHDRDSHVDNIITQARNSLIPIVPITVTVGRQFRLFKRNVITTTAQRVLTVDNMMHESINKLRMQLLDELDEPNTHE